MSLGVLVVSTVIAAALSYLLTPASIRLAVRLGAIDTPTDRKVHATPIPRLGGVAVIAAAAVAVVFQLVLKPTPNSRYLAAGEFWSALLVGLIPILLVSFRDDVRPMGVTSRLLAQIAGASAAVALGIRLGDEVHLFDSDIHIGWLAVPLSIAWLVGVTNAFNIVDGLDGLSGGLALISAISLGAVSIVARRPEMATVSFIVAGALIGFLPYNVHPARVFLGDTGATAIGFTLGAMALSGGSTLSAGMATLVPLLVLGLPIAETLVSMARRTIRRIEHRSGRVMEADRNHFHHRLLTLGLTHQQAVNVLYGAGLLCAAIAVASMFMSYRGAALLLVVFIAGAFIGLQKLGYDEFALIRRGTVLKAYDVPVLRSTFFVVFADLTLVVAALYLAFVLKYDELLIHTHRALAVQMLPWIIATTGVAFVVFRVYRASWRSATLEDLGRPAMAIVAAGIASWVVSSLSFGAPVSLLVLQSLFLFALVASSRTSYRFLKHWSRRASGDGEFVLVYGAGAGGTMAVREAISKPELRLKPVGFVDDDPRLENRFVNGLPVVGSFEDLPELLRSTNVAGVLIATDKMSEDRLQQVAAICDAAGCWMQYFTIRVLSRTEWAGEGSRIAVRPATDGVAVAPAALRNTVPS